MRQVPAFSVHEPEELWMRRPRPRSARFPTLCALLIGAAGIISSVVIYSHYVKPTAVVRSDGVGYYAYLPAYLVEHDPSFRTYIKARWTKAGPPQAAVETVAYDFHQDPRTGNYLDKYPIGEAVMMSPFFLVGHVAARLAGERADGFSGIEEVASGSAALVYMVGGLLILSRSLRRYFRPLVVSATLISIVFGTGLFHYAVFSSVFSHAFSFFLLAALIELVHRWYERQRSLSTAVLLGVVMGLILLVRQPNGVFLLLLPLFGLTQRADVRDRLRYLWERRGEVVTMAAVTALVFAPQLWIWHEATGHWVVNSYQSFPGSFLDLGRPQILKTLFSVDPHGLFPWYPILALACIGGFFLWRSARAMAVPVVVIAVVNAYVISCWNPWFYGAGFGLRPFVDSLSLMAFPLAALYSCARRAMARLAVGVPAVVFCSVTTILMVEYWQGRFGIAGASLSQYVHLLATAF